MTIKEVNDKYNKQKCNEYRVIVLKNDWREKLILVLSMEKINMDNIVGLSAEYDQLTNETIIRIRVS